MRTLFFIIGLVLAVIDIWYIVSRRKPKNYRETAEVNGYLGETMGTIVSISQVIVPHYNDRDTYSYYPTVRYSVNGVTYEVEEENKKSYGTIIRDGDEVDVYYRFDDPGKMMIGLKEKTLERKSKLFPIIIIIYLTAAVIMMFGSALIGADKFFSMLGGLIYNDKKVFIC